MSVWKQTAEKGKGDGEGFEKAPAGNHPAVLVAIVDMGTQRNDFGGQEKWQRRAFFVWELVDAKMSGTKGTNHLIGIDLTVSLNEKATLRKWIEARVGKKMPEGTDYDISKELGQKCLLTVVEKTSQGGKTFPKIAGLAAVPKIGGKPMEIPPAQRTPFSWSLEENYDNDGAVQLPEWVDSLWLYANGELGPVSSHIKKCKEITNPDDGGDDGQGEDKAPAVGGVGQEDPIPF